MDLQGVHIDHYKFIQMIGSGGMGEVYLAEDQRLQRQVAIKVMKLQRTSAHDQTANMQEAVRLFRREARTVAKFHHPHILPLYDYNETMVRGVNVLYMVMPFCPEGSLEDWIREGNRYRQLPPEDVATLLLQAGEALQYAHDQQIIHRDIKPGNFLLQKRKDASLPDLLLSDFGMTTAMNGTTTIAPSIRDTPLYVAPEQWKGNATFATDQYALAVMAYQLLTGRYPFQGEPTYLLYQHLTIEPQPPSTLNPALSTAIDEVILKALAKEPRDRFANVKAFTQAFADVVSNSRELATVSPAKLQAPLMVAPPTLADQPSPPPASPIFGPMPADTYFNPPFPIPDPLPAPPVPKPSKTKKQLPRWQKIALLGSLATVLLAGILIPTQLFLKQSASIPDTQCTDVRQIRNIYSATMPVHLTATTENPIWAFPTYSSIDYGKTAVDNGIVYISTMDKYVYGVGAVWGNKTYKLLTDGTIDSSPTVRDGIAYVGTETGTVYALKGNLGSFDVKWSYPLKEKIIAPLAAVNKYVYVSTNNGNVYAFDENGHLVWSNPFHTGGSNLSAPVVDNGTVYVNATNTGIYAIDANTGKQRWCNNIGNNGSTDIAISSAPTIIDGILYVGSRNKNLYAFDATSGKQIWQFPTHGPIYSTPAVANGTVYIGTETGDHNIYAIDAKSGQQKWRFLPGDTVLSSPCVANGVVYIGSNDGRVYALDSVSGNELWYYQTNGKVTATPIVVGGILYVGSRDGSLYAFRVS